MLGKLFNRSRKTELKDSDSEDWQWYEVYPGTYNPKRPRYKWFPGRDQAGDERPTYSPEPYVQRR